MKKILLALSLVLVLASCSSSSDFEKGKKQLELQGYTDIKNTGHEMFCCSENDSFSTGFKATAKDGTIVKGCFCSSAFKGITIRFE